VGNHSKKEGLLVIDFIDKFGKILNYHVVNEEKMFHGLKDTPILDVTWRKDCDVRFPLFIFEIESEITKSATDNAFKVFSKPTYKYHKPLFFFHIFISYHETQRLESLIEGYNKENYQNYILNSSDNYINLIFDILDQNSRIESKIDLIKISNLLMEFNDLTGLTIESFYQKFISEKFPDLFVKTDFLNSYEKIIISTNSDILNTLYINYLKENIYTNYRQPNYKIMLAFGYSIVTHCAIVSLFSDINEDEMFNFLLEIENSYSPFDLWYPQIRMSEDADFITLSEFPLLLTFLTLSFKTTKYSQYFTQKLFIITESYLNRVGYDNVALHCLSWLTISSKISNSFEYFNFCKKIFDENNGIDKQIFRKLSIGIRDIRKLEEVEFTNPILLCDFNDWKSFCDFDFKQIKQENLLKIMIKSFLQMNYPKLENTINARKQFASYCLMKSLS